VGGLETPARYDLDDGWAPAGCSWPEFKLGVAMEGWKLGAAREWANRHTTRDPVAAARAGGGGVLQGTRSGRRSKGSGVKWQCVSIGPGAGFLIHRFFFMRRKDTLGAFYPLYF
jgi:hypothetical protein